jgi:hypothetical protein
MSLVKLVRSHEGSSAGGLREGQISSALTVMLAALCFVIRQYLQRSRDGFRNLFRNTGALRLWPTSHESEWTTWRVKPHAFVN